MHLALGFLQGGNDKLKTGEYPAILHARLNYVIPPTTKLRADVFLVCRQVASSVSAGTPLNHIAKINLHTGRENKVRIASRVFRRYRVAQSSFGRLSMMSKWILRTCIGEMRASL